MWEQLKKIRSSKYIIYSHEIIYAAAIIYFIIAYVMDLNSIMVVNTAGSAGLFILAVLEWLSHKMKTPFLEKKWPGMIYHIARLCFAGVFYYIAILASDRVLFTVMLSLFAIETIFYFAFDDLVKRIAFYGIFAILHGSISLFVTMYQKSADQNLIALCFQEFFIVVVIVFALVSVGEVIARMYIYFEKQIFAQRRTVAELNEANEVLKQHQEQINLINEKLGMQKIELREANIKINRSHDEISVQNEISSTMTATLGREDMLERVTNIMQIRLDMDMVMIVLEEDNSLLVPGEKPKGRFVALTTSLGEDFESQILDSVHKTDLKELLLLSKTYIRNTATNTTKFFAYLEDDNELPSVICLPIQKQTERYGTLVMGRKKENAFMDSRAFYENIASQLSIGISSAHMYDKMNDMAIRDGLTRIYNRGHLTEVLNDYLSEAISQKVPVSLALFDIDKFKMINDTYGHQCGDAVIRHVAALLNESAIENGGIAGRYGGEEFVIAFLNRGLDETYEIVKQVHDRIREEEVIFADKVVNVRASAGVASYPVTCSNPGDLLTRADWAMYHSKRNGRDQITIDSDQIVDRM
ncbi:MAG: GGDEF domain-containing protein [Lachnospiraceae bacterium]|nr:GGDEF domain-containing protein [Lachnospiraceae bacterium]